MPGRFRALAGTPNLGVDMGSDACADRGPEVAGATGSIATGIGIPRFVVHGSTLMPATIGSIRSLRSPRGIAAHLVISVDEVRYGLAIATDPGRPCGSVPYGAVEGAAGRLGCELLSSWGQAGGETGRGRTRMVP